LFLSPWKIIKPAVALLFHFACVALLYDLIAIKLFSFVESKLIRPGKLGTHPAGLPKALNSDLGQIAKDEKG
jgi:hypothetical protein